MKATTPATKLMSKNHIIIILLSYKLKLLCFYLVYIYALYKFTFLFIKSQSHVQNHWY